MELNDTPLEDQFFPMSQKNIKQDTYPLKLALCEDCGYLHLPYIVNPEMNYADYVYESSVTVGLRDHYDHYAESIIDEFDIDENSFVVDLGSNDGSMLASFKKQNMNILGVEPVKTIAEKANNTGLPTINDFFTADLAEKIEKKYGEANIITANYMYANVDDVISFTKAVKNLLTKDGIFVIQTGYHPEQMKILMFDYIYHEHFSYFTVGVLNKVFQLCGMELLEVKKIPPKGGSIRVVAQLKDSSRRIGKSVNDFISEENKNGIYNIETYKKFDDDIKLVKKSISKILQSIKKEGKRIVGLGASHSTTTLTYHFDLDLFMEYIVDDNPIKQGCYSPGHHLPVYSCKKLYDDKPDYVIVLAWQHRENIIKKHKDILSLGIKFFIPLPEPIFIENN